MSVPTLSAKVKPHNDVSGRPARVLAFAELTIADAFIIRNIKILSKGPGKDFVVFPAEKIKGRESFEWFDVAHPLTSEARAASVGLILREYRKLL